MKRTLSSLLLLLSVFSSRAQDRIWVETGINGPVGYGAGLDFLNSDYHYLTPYLKPGVAAGYEHRLIPHLFIGGRLSFDNYTFTYEHIHEDGVFNLFGGTTTTSHTQATVNSNYITAAPMLDVGLGRRGIVHLFVMPGISILLKGTMRTEVNDGKGYDTSYNSSSSLSKAFCRVGWGVSEQFSLGKDWKIMLTETMYNNAAGNVMRSIGTIDESPTVNYFSLQFGFMHKYHHKAKTEEAENTQ